MNHIHNHKCPDHVSLNVLHELMEIFQLEDGPDYASDDDVDDAAPSEAVVLAVQNLGQQQPTIPKRRTMRFQGSIGNQDIIILLDSGSVGTFITRSCSTVASTPSTL